MRAFVLSGGGTRGAAQAGALRALLEAGIVPEMLVGCSIGALNATHLAANPSLEQTCDLEALWRRVTPHVIFGSGAPLAAWRTISRGPSFYPNDGIKRFLLQYGPRSAQRFGGLRIPLYLLAAKLRTGDSVVFGDDPQERILYGVLASIAMPPVLEPVFYNGEWLIDGGVASVLPLRVAIERGATTIYALNLVGAVPDVPNPPDIWAVTELSLDAVFRRQVEQEIIWAASQSGVTLYLINLEIKRGISVWDLSHTEELLRLGYETAREHLANLRPLRPAGQPARGLWGQLMTWVRRKEGDALP
jgi:NTE family protein